jgi:hypothetical protein
MALGEGHNPDMGTTQGSCIVKGGTRMALREGHNPNTGTTQSGRIAKGGGGGTHILVTFLSKEGLIEHKNTARNARPEGTLCFVQINQHC